MGDLAKLVGRFFARDFMYFLGGLFVLLAGSWTWAYQQHLSEIIDAMRNLPTVAMVPLAGAAYIIGYILHYVYGLLGAISTSDRLIPGSGIQRSRETLAKWIFYALNRYHLEEAAALLDQGIKIEDIRWANLKPVHVFAVQALHPNQDYISRAITLHHFSSVLGACIFTCGCVFAFALPSLSAAILVIVSLFVGLFLWLDSHYRAFQIAFATMMIRRWAPDIKAAEA